jgi:hypothetical protein
LPSFETPVTDLNPSVHAESTCDHSTNIFTLASQDDADSLSDCTTILGNITVKVTTDSYISLKGVTEITGNLLLLDSDAKLHNFSAPDLTSIGGLFEIGNQDIAHADLQSLTTAGSIYVHSISLTTLDFSAGIKNLTGALLYTLDEYTTMFEVSETKLTSLNGLLFPWAESIFISSNSMLKSVTLAITSVGPPYGDLSGRSLYIIGNSAYEGLNLSLPNLTNVTGNGYLYATNNLFIPELQSVQGQLQLEGLDMDVFNAPKLERIVLCNSDESNCDSGGFQILESTIGSLNLPQLETVYKLEMAYNSADLYTNISMPNIKSIGDVLIETGVSPLNSLNFTTGIDCTSWANLLCSGVIDTLECEVPTQLEKSSCISSTMPATAVPTSSSPTSKSSHSPTSDSSNSTTKSMASQSNPVSVIISTLASFVTLLVWM